MNVSHNDYILHLSFLYQNKNIIIQYSQLLFRSTLQLQTIIMPFI